MVTSAKHSLNVLKDDMFDPNSSVAHPSAKTFSVGRIVLPHRGYEAGTG